MRNHQQILKLSNQRGNILTSAFIIMIVLSMSVMAIGRLALNQLNRANQQVESLTTNLFHQAMLEQSIYEFEEYLVATDYDFTGYFIDKTTGGITDYGVLVEDVSGTIDLYGDYTDFDGTDEIVYRFTYSYNGGNSELIMYSYMSKWGSDAENISPMDFQIATNGDLIINGGYLEDAQIFGDEIIFTNVSPFINPVTGNPDKTTGGFGLYPDYRLDGTQTNTYYRLDYVYCEPDCYDLGASALDPIAIDRTEFLDIETEPNVLETGTISKYRINGDLFSTFDLSSVIIDYVANDGPTGADIVTDSMTLATIGSVIWNSNSGDQEVLCIPNPPGPDDCFDWASSEPYTRLNTASDFDPTSGDEVLGYAGIWNGDLTINYDLEMTNMLSANTETLIVTGDLTIDNINALAPLSLDAFIVVLGDLNFTGYDVSVSGGFYVVGETNIDFAGDYGFVEPASSPYFTLMGIDNVFVNTHYSSSSLGSAVSRFSWFVYTDESIYIDAVNSRLQIEGALFAGAKGVSGNDLPLEDDGTPVRGIVINAFNGYINGTGNDTVVPGYTSFDFLPMDSTTIGSSFREVPSFDEVFVSDGLYTMKRSTLYYNN
jgi:hypothetical protein